MRPQVFAGLTKLSKCKFLRDEGLRSPNKIAELKNIRSAIESVYAIDSMLVARNEPEYSHARMTYVHYIISNSLFIDRDQIGRDLHRDRTLMYYYTKKAKELLEFDKEFQYKYEQFLQIIENRI